MYFRASATVSTGFTAAAGLGAGAGSSVGVFVEGFAAAGASEPAGAESALAGTAVLAGLVEGLCVALDGVAGAGAAVAGEVVGAATGLLPAGAGAFAGTGEIESGEGCVTAGAVAAGGLLETGWGGVVVSVASGLCTVGVGLLVRDPSQPNP